MQIIVVTAKPAADLNFFWPAAGGLEKSMAAKPKKNFRPPAYRSTHMTALNMLISDYTANKQ